MALQFVSESYIQLFAPQQSQLDVLPGRYTDEFAIRTSTVLKGLLPSLVLTTDKEIIYVELSVHFEISIKTFIDCNQAYTGFLFKIQEKDIAWTGGKGTYFVIKSVQQKLHRKSKN